MFSDPKYYDRYILLPLKQFGFNDENQENTYFRLDMIPYTEQRGTCFWINQ